MVTLDDVARAAGVSRMTVSNVLNGKPIVRESTAQRVRIAAQQVGYQPNLAARALKRGNTGILGLTVADFDLIFPAELLSKLSDAARERGWHTIAQQTRYARDFESYLLHDAASQACDGLIVCWPNARPQVITSLASNKPLVAFDAFGFEQQVDSVLTPCKEGMAAVVHHVKTQGYSHIAVLGAGTKDLEQARQQPTSAQLRLLGVLEACSNNLDFNASRDAYACPWNRSEGYKHAYALLSKVQRGEALYDAIICCNDPIAIGALKAAHDLGFRVPQDLAIVGFDGVEDGNYTSPGLTSVVINQSDIIKHCLDFVTSRIQATEQKQSLAPRTVTVSFSLTARGSAERM